jgi:hypothetical protein
MFYELFVLKILFLLGVFYIYTLGFYQASTSFSKLLPILGMLFVLFIHTYVVLLD